MTEVLKDELVKFKANSGWRFHTFVYPDEVLNIKTRLKLCDIDHKLLEVLKYGEVVGYKVYIKWE